MLADPLPACGGGATTAIEGTSPIAPYLDEEELDEATEEEVADALGAGSLNSFDRDRMNELGDTARRWAVATEPLWTVLFDTDAPIEGFVAELDARGRTSP